MTVHSTHDETTEPTSGAALLPIFAIATVIATVAICVVIVAPMLSRLIRPEER
jgi:hypothetical protein